MKNKSKFLLLIFSLFLSTLFLSTITADNHIDVRVITNTNNVSVPNNSPGTVVCSITFTPESEYNEFKIIAQISLTPSGTGYMVIVLTDATFTQLTLNSTNIQAVQHYTSLAPSSASIAWAGIFPQQSITVYLGVATAGAGGTIVAGSAQLVITEYSKSLPPSEYYTLQMDFMLCLLVFIILVFLLLYNIYCLKFTDKIFLGINLAGTLSTQGILFLIYTYMSTIYTGLILFHVFITCVSIYINIRGVIPETKDKRRK